MEQAGFCIESIDQEVGVRQNDGLGPSLSLGTILWRIYALKK